MNGTAIDVQHLIKIYKGETIPAVNNVSFTIDSGAIFGLLGPNGAGKTTTISILCGLRRASAGKVTVLGLELGKQREKAKQLIGVVPQDIALYPSLTAFENLQYIGNMYGLRGESLKKKIRSHLETVGLQDQEKNFVENFSGGMKRRINLLAGILHEPKLLFLDEPTVGVDVQSRNAITELLRDLNRKGCTIIYTSHLMEEAQNLCSDIVVIDHGTVIAQGKPKEMIKESGVENLEQLFLQLTGRKLRD
jgi:ABC-2 type transport system ATP-binding protein